MDNNSRHISSNHTERRRSIDNNCQAELVEAPAYRRVLHFDKLNVTTLFLLIALLLTFTSAFAQTSPIVEGELIIQVNPKYQAKILENAYSDYDLSIDRVLSKRMNIVLASFDDANFDEQTVLQELSNSPYVKIVQLNHRLEYRSTSPDDLDSLQWNMNNYGQEGGLFGADIDAVEAWDSTTGGTTKLGDEIVVAVIDTRFDINHEDIDYFENVHDSTYNGFDDDGNGYIDDFKGWNAQTNDDNVHSSFGNHATHISGIIGAKGNNAQGVTGINWDIKIMPVYSLAIEADVVIAYDYIITMREQYALTSGSEGAFIVATNSSFGIDEANPADYPIWCAMYDSMGAYGILSAVATTNDNANVDVVGDVPSNCASEFLIAVSRTNRQDKPSAGIGLNNIDIHAPGVQVRSTLANDQYGNLTGTSMASPHIAGALGLMYSQACPNMINTYYGFPDSIALLMKKYLLDAGDFLPDLINKSTTESRLNLYKSILELDNYNCPNCAYDIEIDRSEYVCEGTNDGEIHLAATGSSGYSFTWSDGSPSGASRTGLAAGTYTVTISDVMGCDRVQTFHLNEKYPYNIDTLGVKNTSTSTSGGIYISASGGKHPALYSLNGGSQQTVPYFSGLSTGTYNLSVQDSSGCSFDTTLTINFVPTSITETNIGNLNISVYPNPIKEATTISLRSDESIEATLILQDVLGNTVYTKQVDVQASKNQFPINLQKFAKGVYLLKVAHQEQTLSTIKLSKL